MNLTTHGITSPGGGGGGGHCPQSHLEGTPVLLGLVTGLGYPGKDMGPEAGKGLGTRDWVPPAKETGPEAGKEPDIREWGTRQKGHGTRGWGSPPPHPWV